MNFESMIRSKYVARRELLLQWHLTENELLNYFNSLFSTNHNELPVHALGCLKISKIISD